MITQSDDQATNNSHPSYHPTGLLHTHNYDEAQYRAWRNAVYEELELAGMPNLAWDWLNCSTSYATFEPSRETSNISDAVKGVYVCGADPAHPAKAVCFTCHNRCCPDCARRETARLLARYMPLVEVLSKKHSQRYSFKHIVLTSSIELTAENCKTEVNRLLPVVAETLSMLLPDDWRKDQGFIVTTEFGHKGKKLHFHVFMYGQYIPQVELADTWNWCNGGIGKVVWIGEITASNALFKLKEQVKYVTKFWSRDKETGEVVYFEPVLIPTLIKVLTSTRRIRSYGIFYKVKQTVTVAQCLTCSAALTRWSPEQWSTYIVTGWTPGEQREQLHSKRGNNSLFSSSKGDVSNPSEVPRQEVLINVWNSHL